jgi:hypothetical protein
VSPQVTGQYSAAAGSWQRVVFFLKTNLHGFRLPFSVNANLLVPSRQEVSSTETGDLVGDEVTGDIIGDAATQLRISCPVAYTNMRAEPGEPVSKEHTLITRVPEPDQLRWVYS